MDLQDEDFTTFRAEPSILGKANSQTEIYICTEQHEDLDPRQISNYTDIWRFSDGIDRQMTFIGEGYYTGWSIPEDLEGTPPGAYDIDGNLLEGEDGKNAVVMYLAKTPKSWDDFNQGKEELINVTALRQLKTNVLSSTNLSKLYPYFVSTTSADSFEFSR